MRKEFAEILFNEMTVNDKIFVLTADLGYKMWDKIKKEFPNRFINVGAAEQLLIGAGIGLSYTNHIPILYSITPFLLYRPFEMLRTYVNYEKINVKLIGSGRDKDYNHDGISHWANDDKKIMSNLSNIKCYYPSNYEELSNSVKEIINNNEPSYLNLRRTL